MSNIAEILRKAEYLQEESEYESEMDLTELYMMGRKCYCVKDYDGADYWWEKAARGHYIRAEQALIDLYNSQLKRKKYSIKRTSHSEAMGRKLSSWTGRWTNDMMFCQ